MKKCYILLFYSCTLIFNKINCSPKLVTERKQRLRNTAAAGSSKYTFSENYRYATWSYFTKNMLKNSKKMRLLCAKCKKCVRTLPNAKKCGTCGKHRKCGIFVRRTIEFFPGGNNSCIYTIYKYQLLSITVCTKYILLLIMFTKLITELWLLGVSA